MDENKKKVARTGSIMVRINGKFYEVPDTYLFKSHDGKDVYLSGVSVDWDAKGKAIATVKFVEEGRFEDVPLDLLEKFIEKKHVKFVIFDEEYDIPLHLAEECTRVISKVSKHAIRLRSDIKRHYRNYLFKSN